VNIQLGTLGSTPSLGTNMAGSPFDLAVSLFQQFGGKGAFDTAGLAQTLNQLAQTDPNAASGVATEIANMLPPMAQGELARDMALIDGNPAESLDCYKKLDWWPDKLIEWPKKPEVTEKQALEIVKTYKLNVDQPIYIGGGGDGYIGSIVQDYTKNNKFSNFATHYETEKIQQTILAFKTLKKPIILVGHSWGGEEAIFAAKYAIRVGAKVDLLVTIDPVVGNKFGANEMKEMVKRMGGSWTTVRAIGYQTDSSGFRGDYWASLGGRMSEKSQKFASNYYEYNGGHENFEEMIVAAGINQKIQDIYKK
jgi:Lipase (class 3)